jgi:glycosyltransferase involved in cell wall biosynthesis
MRRHAARWHQSCIAEAMRQRKIAIMGRLLDQNDGMGVYSQYLTRHLLELDPHTQYSILLRTPNRRDLFREYANAETHVLPARSILYWDQIVVARAARRLDVDLIFNPKFSVPFLSRRPSVFVHQGWDWYVNPRNYEWWDNLYIRLMLPLYDRKATRTLAISQATIDGMRHYAGLKLPDCVVSHAGIGPNFTARRDEQELAQFRARHALPERFILTVARAYHGGHNKQRAYPGGNTERLMRGYRRYRRDGGTLPLVVIGYRIEDYLKSRNFTDADLADVRFLGFVPNVEMHLAYQAAECFVLATMCESFGIPILEALATGCPAIVPNTCASPEVAGGAARLINPHAEEDIAQALREVTGSAELRAQMRERGLRRAQELTWRETARLTLQVFDEIVPRTSVRDRTLASAQEV